MKNDDFEQELDAIRAKLYEQTKDMTSEEQIIFFRTMVKDGFARHGINARYVDAPIVRSET